MSRATRKLAKGGDVEGLLAVARDAGEKDREAVLDGLLACMETHPDRVRSARATILAFCVPLARDTRSPMRTFALGIATALRDPSAAGLALAALADPEASVRISGLLSVFHLQPPGSLARALELLRDEDSWVRRYAAAAVERVGDRSAVPVLLEARDREGDAGVREKIDEVIEILEGKRPPTPIEPLLVPDEA